MCTTEHRARGARAPLVGRAEELMQRERAPQIDVRVVLPREADTAERLDAVLAVAERGIERERRSGRDGDVAAVLLVGARGIPRRRARELGAGEHVGATVFRALELSDRPPELDAFFGVLGRGVDAPLRDADR